MCASQIKEEAKAWIFSFHISTLLHILSSTACHHGKIWRKFALFSRVCLALLIFADIKFWAKVFVEAQRFSVPNPIVWESLHDIEGLQIYWFRFWLLCWVLIVLWYCERFIYCIYKSLFFFGENLKILLSSETRFLTSLSSFHIV